MILAETYEQRFFENILASEFALTAHGEGVISYILVDSGNGYRPLNPLIVSLNHQEVPLPLLFTQGEHTVQLLGEPLNGDGLILAGYNLGAVSNVRIGHAAQGRIQKSNVKPMGATNGTNTDFALPQPFVAWSTRVYVNGIRIDLHTHYAEISNTMLRFSEPPQEGDLITVDYQPVT